MLGCGEMKGWTDMEAAATMADVSGCSWDDSRADAVGCPLLLPAGA